MKNSTKALIRRIEKAFPSRPRFEKEEYKNKVFLLEIPEGGDLNDVDVRSFSGFVRTEDDIPKEPIRFYAKVVGFEDINAPTRNWGMDLKKFLKSY